MFLTLLGSKATDVENIGKLIILSIKYLFVYFLKNLTQILIPKHIVRFLHKFHIQCNERPVK